MDKGKRRHSRRAFLHGSGAAALAAATSIGWPRIVRAQDRLTLRFRTIPDPDGWHASLRLKGDWMVLEVNDGVLSGFGEASHSNDDEACKRAAAEIFAEHYAGLRTLSLETLATKEREIAALDPGFVRATAFSGLNQVLYDLLAKREQVPVWQLFRTSTTISGIPLYTTSHRTIRRDRSRPRRACMPQPSIPSWCTPSSTRSTAHARGARRVSARRTACCCCPTGRAGAWSRPG